MASNGHLDIDEGGNPVDKTLYHKIYIAYAKLLVKIGGFERGHSYQFQLVFIWLLFVLELG
jgi:hypothetical protein